MSLQARDAAKASVCKERGVLLLHVPALPDPRAGISALDHLSGEFSRYGISVRHDLGSFALNLSDGGSQSERNKIEKARALVKQGTIPSAAAQRAGLGTANLRAALSLPPGQLRKLTQSQGEEILALRASGMKWRDIAPITLWSQALPQRPGEEHWPDPKKIAIVEP